MAWFNNLNGIDTFILAVIALSALFACFSGFLREVLSIVGWVAALASSIYFAPKMTIFNNYIQDEKVASVVAIATVFLGVLIFFMIISYVISGIVHASPIGLFDRIFGLLFGVIRGLLLLTIVYIFAIQLIEKENLPKIVKEAKLMPIIEKTAEIALGFADEDTKNILKGYGAVSKKIGELKPQDLGLSQGIKALNESVNKKKAEKITAGTGATETTGSLEKNSTPESKNTLPAELDAAIPKVKTVAPATAP